MMSDTGVHLHGFFQPVCEEFLPGYGWRWMADPRKNYWRHPNGHKIWLRPYKLKPGESAQKSNVQGINATACFLDECGDVEAKVMKLLRGRNRITHPTGGPPIFGFVGWPTHGAWWTRKAKEHGWHSWTCTSRINAHNLADNWLDDMRADMSADEYRAIVEADPQPPGGLVCRSWSEEPWSRAPYEGGNILYGWKYDSSKHTCRLAIDFGKQHPAVLFIAHDPSLKVDVIFDQICPLRRTDEDELVGLILQKAWPRKYWASKPKGSPIALDAASGDPMGTHPTDKKGLDAISQLLLPPRQGGVGLFVEYSFDPVKRTIANGIRRTNRRICDHLGNRKLVAEEGFWKRDLADKNGRGIAQSITRLTYKEGTNDYPKGPKADELDHVYDALRYDCINWHWETTSRFDHKSLARVSDDMPEPRARELTGKTKPGRSRRLIGGGR